MSRWKNTNNIQNAVPAYHYVKTNGRGAAYVFIYGNKTRLAAGGGAKLYCVEFDGALSRILEDRFPEAVVVNDSAENIEKILAGEDSKRVKAIVSCLPLVSLPGKVVSAILNASENALPKGGRFIQFTYNLVRSPESLGFKKMKHEKVSFVALNIPPARVDVFVKE